MHIGVVPVLTGHCGGVYQYSFNILTALYQAERDFDVTLFAEDRAPLGFLADRLPNWHVRADQPRDLKGHVAAQLRRLSGTEHLQHLWEPAPYPMTDPEEAPDPDVVNYQPERGRWFARAGANLMLYPAPTTLTFEAGIPFVVSLHSLKFGLLQSYPELAQNGRDVGYDYCVRNCARYAARILADSEYSRQEILDFGKAYGLTEERVSILTPQPSVYLDAEIDEVGADRILAKHGVVEPYLFYPASFWPHKNHIGLLEALELVRNEFTLTPQLVLCGSRSGSIRKKVHDEVLGFLHASGVEKQVKVLGYLPDEDMAALYSRARAVVIPQVLGAPIALIRDAWACGCPVLGPRIPAFQDQAGEAALLVDPRSTEELAEGIRKIWTEATTRERLAELGRARVASHPFHSFTEDLVRLLKETAATMDSPLDS